MYMAAVGCFSASTAYRASICRGENRQATADAFDVVVEKQAIRLR